MITYGAGVTWLAESSKRRVGTPLEHAFYPGRMFQGALCGVVLDRALQHAFDPKNKRACRGCRDRARIYE